MASESRSGFQVSRSRPATRMRSRVERLAVCESSGDMHCHGSGPCARCAGGRLVLVVAGRREGVTVSRDDEVRSRRDDSVRLPLLHFRADLVSSLLVLSDTLERAGCRASRVATRARVRGASNFLHLSNRSPVQEFSWQYSS